MAEIKLEQLTKVYPDGTKAVKELDLEIADGELVVLVGPSGCGKTSALRMVAGLEDITDGKVWIGGRVVNRVPPKDRDIAMIFQNYALYPHMTAAGNMGFALRMRKLPKGQIKTRVTDAAGVLGPMQTLNKRPRTLSGGQRHRVAMGRPIVRELQPVRDRGFESACSVSRQARDPRRQAGAHRGCGDCIRRTRRSAPRGRGRHPGGPRLGRLRPFRRRWPTRPRGGRQGGGRGRHSGDHRGADEAERQSLGRAGRPYEPSPRGRADRARRRYGPTSLLRSGDGRRHLSRSRRPGSLISRERPTAARTRRRRSPVPRSRPRARAARDRR